MTTRPGYGGSDPSSYFGQARPEILSLIPHDATRILDIGCGAGELGAATKRTRELWYCGVEYDSEAAAAAKNHLDEVHVTDITSGTLPYRNGSFDLILFADVLEHVQDSLAVLRRWLPLLQADGRVLVSLPNVRHFTVTLPLLLMGSWSYADRGILDRTHLRFFTRESSRQLLHDCGLTIEIESQNVRHKYRLAQLLDYLSFGLLRDHMVQQWIYLARCEG